MSACDQLKDIAREATHLYRPIWKVKDYAVSSQPIKQDFQITPMVSQLTNTGEFFIVQDAHTFEIDRMSLMSLIDKELDLSCLLGKMTGLMNMYADILGNDKELPEDTPTDEDCNDKYEWYGTGGTSYFISFEEAELYIARKIARAMSGDGDARLLDCAPFDIRDKFPELIV